MGDIFGGGSASAQQVFQPSGTAAFDTSYQDLIKQSIANNPYAANAGTATNIFNAAYNNPFAPGYTGAASAGGTALNTAGTAATAAAPQIGAAAGSLIPATAQVLQSGFDPQRELYQRTLQQITDASNVQGAQSGTTKSPYGASVANAANENFNIDWQAQQLAKQMAALQSAGQGVGAAGAGATTAANLGATGAQDIANAGALPFQAQQNVTGDQSQALQALLSVLGNQGGGAYTGQNLDAIMKYLGLGAQQSNNQAQLDQQAQQAQDSGLGSLFGSLLSAGTSLINGPASLFNFAAPATSAVTGGADIGNLATAVGTSFL